MNPTHYTLRTDLGGSAPGGSGQTLLSMLHISDAHVIDTVSPARCEWIELLASDPYWAPLLHMHRPYEALTHWALAAHVEAARRNPVAPFSQRPYDLALCTGDNIDNAQANELQTFLAIMAGGRTALSAYGGVHESGHELAPTQGPGAWPFWCPDETAPDLWKAQGYPQVPGFVARASAELHAPGLGFAWTSVPGNHDVMRQGTAFTNPALEAIATGSHKVLAGAPGFRPQDPLNHFVEHPDAFSAGGVARAVSADPHRRAIDLREWIAAHLQHGALGYGQAQLRAGRADAVIDTEHARIILLDTNHPGGDYQGSVGAAQVAWLEEHLSEVDRDGRIAVLASHHGSASLTNTRGDDPERLLAEALTAVAHRHPCVLAWLVGHRHVHRITPHPHPQGKGHGFWEITTASTIDWPSQTRAVEFVKHSDGSLEIVCTLRDHAAPAGSLAALHRDLAKRFAGDIAGHLQGEKGDGDVRLVMGRR
jgi:metallophosphoesterase (TIGR03767 family)